LFDVTIEDEGRKVNAQLDSPYNVAGTVGYQVQQLYQLVCDPRWDPLFDREDANGVRVTRQDWIVHLRDWADLDQVSSALVASFPGAPCLMIPGPSPFEPGFGDEDLPYDRGEDRYKAKNARLDSVEELHLVAGVSDLFMAAFGDRLTVYLAREAPRNVNTLEPQELLELAWLVADPPGQPGLLDAELPKKLQAAVADATMGGFLTISPLQFAAIVEAFGVKVNTLALSTNSKQFLTDRSFVFRVRSAGSVGAVKKTIDAVLTFDPEQNRAVGQPPGQQQQQQQQALAAAAKAAGMPGATAAAAAGAAGATAAGAEKPSRLIRWREE
jgi:general secretion pathway protein K